MPNIIRGKKATPATGNAAGVDRARLDRLDQIDAMTDAGYLELDRIHLAENASAPCADHVLASAVIDFFGDAMQDLAPGSPSTNWSKREGRARMQAIASTSKLRGFKDTSACVPEARTILLGNILRRSMAWHRAEFGAVQSASRAGSVAVNIALTMQRQAWITLASLRAYGIAGDRSPLRAVLSCMALWSHNPGRIAAARHVARNPGAGV